MAPCFGTICRIIKGNKHTRIITIIDNLIPHEKRIGDRVLSGYWIGSVDGCIAMSRSVLDYLSKFNADIPKFYCDPKPYQEIISHHHLEDQVIMSYDFIPDSQVLNYFCAADLVVQPCKSATQSGVTQIAYHLNKPMIIRNVGGLAEFIPHEKVGYVVNPEPAEILAAILRFYGEGKEIEFSANAALEKEKYSWVRMVEAIDKLLGFSPPADKN